MHTVVAVLYLLGAFVTGLGVLTAFGQARRELRQLDALDAYNRRFATPDLAGAIDDPEGHAERRTVEDEVQATVDDRVRALGFERAGGATFEDMRLPLDYWAKRSALRDAVASFRRGGLIALLGLAISTGASVWSLYLPTS